MPGGAPAAEEGAGSFAVGRGGVPAVWGQRVSRHSPPPYGPLRAAGGGRYRVAGPRGNPLCAPRSAACPRAPPSRPDPLCAPYPTRCVPLSPLAILPPGPDPLCSPVYHPPPPCFPVPTLSVPQCPGPDPFSAAVPPAPGPERVPRALPGDGGLCSGRGAAGWERRWRPPESPWGQSGLSGTRGEHTPTHAAVGWALPAAPGQLSFSQRSGRESLWLKAGVS